MGLNLAELLKKRQGENYTLQSKYINPTFSKVLKIIGFDRVYTKGQGQYLWDAQGNRYLDFICGYGVFNLGRNHPTVCQILKDYLDLDYPNLVKMDAPLISGLLAEELVKWMPEGLDTVFFANSGTEGVETTLKFARAASGKNRIIYNKGAFHGLTLGSLSVNGSTHFREQFGSLLPECDAVPFNDIEALERALSTRDAAAFIVEPIQGKGIHIPSDDYLSEAERLCKKYGAYFIVDEVQVGMGRTGKFLALEHWNVHPDLVIVSKSLSAGQVPISAAVGRREIFLKVFDRLDRCVVHSTTFSQNAMAAAAGLAALHILREEHLIENAAKMGSLLISELEKRKPQFEMLKDVRGKGLIVGVEFGEPKSLKLKMAWKLIHKADQGLFSQAIIMPLIDKHHILTQVGGHNVDIIKLSPALCINEQDIRDFLVAFDQVVADCHKFPGPIWEVGSLLAKHALSQRNHSADASFTADSHP